MLDKQDQTSEKAKWKEAYDRVHPTTQMGKLLQRVRRKFYMDMDLAYEEYEVEKQLLEDAFLTDTQYLNGMTALQRKHIFGIFTIKRRLERRLRLGVEIE